MGPWTCYRNGEFQTRAMSADGNVWDRPTIYKDG